MFSEIGIRKNGILDVIIFQFLNYLILWKTYGGNLLEIFGQEFLKASFMTIVIFLNLLKIQIPKWIKNICLLYLNFTLFLDRSFFQTEVNRMIDLLLFINIYIIFSSKFKK
jgi:hypothetical protein